MPSRENAVAAALSCIGGFIGVCADTDARAAVTAALVSAIGVPVAPAATAAAVASVRTPVRE